MGKNAEINSLIKLKRKLFWFGPFPLAFLGILAVILKMKEIMMVVYYISVPCLIVVALYFYIHFKIMGLRINKKIE